MQLDTKPMIFLTESDYASAKISQMEIRKNEK